MKLKHLPTFDAIGEKPVSERSPLELFIHENDPSAKDKSNRFRKELVDLINDIQEKQVNSRAFNALKIACEKFVDKVDKGKARSTDSYLEMQKALKLAESVQVVPVDEHQKTVGDLKNLIKELPDSMPVGLLDMGSDDPWETNYRLESFTSEYTKEADGEEMGEGEMLFFTFINKRVEDVMGDYHGQLEDEFEKLSHKIQKLEEFMTSDKFKILEKMDQILTYLQLNAMESYKTILEERVVLG